MKKTLVSTALLVTTGLALAACNTDKTTGHATTKSPASAKQTTPATKKSPAPLTDSQKIARWVTPAVQKHEKTLEDDFTTLGNEVDQNDEVSLQETCAKLEDDVNTSLSDPKSGVAALDSENRAAWTDYKRAAQTCESGDYAASAGFLKQGNLHTENATAIIQGAN